MGLKLVQAWVDFATVGDPTPPGSELGAWSAVRAGSHEYLRIDAVSAMEMDQDYLDRVNFWKSIMETRPLP